MHGEMPSVFIIKPKYISIWKQFFTWWTVFEWLRKMDGSIDYDKNKDKQMDLEWNSANERNKCTFLYLFISVEN